MNLLEALEAKRALESIVVDITETLSSKLHDKNEVSSSLSEIDKYIEKLFYFERVVEKKYSNTMITDTESIADVISYIDCFSRKIDVLRSLLLLANREKILSDTAVDLDINTLIATIHQYEDIKNTMIKKVKTACASITIEDNNQG